MANSLQMLSSSAMSVRSCALVGMRVAVAMAGLF